MKNAYFDHASATPVKQEVIDAMLPYFDREFANPSTVYEMGARIRQTVEEQRAKVADLIHAEPSEIIFTSSGAEANNLAVKGVALAQKSKGNHIIISSIEHHSVLNAARFLERLDYEVSFLPVDRYGLVDPDQLSKAIRNETVLVSIMHANNEIGTIQPVEKLAAVCREKGVAFHTDAVSSVGNIPVDVNKLGVDLLSLSGPSFGAPKGTGALYFKKKVRLMPLIHGGIQESGRRAGTENVPGIVGLGKAAELSVKDLNGKIKHVITLRDRLVQGVENRIEQVRFTGHPDKRLPGHASFCVEAVEGEALIYMLAQNGVYVNTGSACASKALKTSPVLVAIGLPADIAQGSVVFTLESSNSADEIDYAVDRLESVVERLRSVSPIWRENKVA